MVITTSTKSTLLRLFLSSALAAVPTSFAFRPLSPHHRQSASLSRRRTPLPSSVSARTTTTTLRPMTSNDDTTTASAARQAGLFRHTPLIYSPTLSQKCQKDVFLKLDCLQSSGSFKDRGMGHLCYTLQQEDKAKMSKDDDTTTTTQFISSSGGNAGLAVASTGQAMSNVSVHVIVPETTKPMVVQKLQDLYGATVTVTGENWNAADQVAREMAAAQATAHYVSPYDNALLWQGHSTVIDEIVHDLPNKGNGIGTLIVSVGGGGLLCGVLEGLQRNHEQGSSKKTRVIAAETVGACSFAKALEAGQLVRLDGIDSIATSLGALEVTQAALDRVQSTSDATAVTAATCTDAEAVQACLDFAAEHKILVEPACGAALAVAYCDRLRNEYLSSSSDDGPIVIEVCGGSAVSVDLLTQWKTELGL